MTAAKEALLRALGALRVEGFGQRHDLAMVAPTVFERDGRVFVSAEDGQPFADYYGEFRGGYPWVNQALEELAKRHGGYWEWESPGCIYFVEA